MRYLFISSLFLILFSCASENKKEDKFTIIENGFEIFDEPSIQDIKNLDFYLLVIERKSFTNPTIISIRNKQGKTFAYFKEIEFEKFPPIGDMIKGDTTSFNFQTIFVKLNSDNINEIRKQIYKNNLLNLQDSIVSDHIGGGCIGIMFYSEGNFKFIKRNYTSRINLDDKILEFVDNLSRQYFQKNALK